MLLETKMSRFEEGLKERKRLRDSKDKKSLYLAQYWHTRRLAEKLVLLYIRRLENKDRIVIPH